MYRAKIMVLLLVALAFVASPAVVAQEWSAEQTEVWTAVQAAWDLALQDDPVAMMATLHPDYTGWSYSEDFPDDKASTDKWITYNFTKYKWVLFDLKPAAITVDGDFAIVHYFYSGVYTDLAKEEDDTTKGRWTDIYKKEGGQWLLIGDHGGRTKE
jgi:ketosteroid isomerase-like protein